MFKTLTSDDLSLYCIITVSSICCVTRNLFRGKCKVIRRHLVLISFERNLWSEIALFQICSTNQRQTERRTTLGKWERERGEVCVRRTRSKKEDVVASDARSKKGRCKTQRSTMEFTTREERTEHAQKRKERNRKAPYDSQFIYDRHHNGAKWRETNRIVEKS